MLDKKGDLDPMQEQIAAFTAVDWHAFPGPREYNAYVPEQVPHALRALTEATTEAQAWDAYNRLLFAIGNNHRGTLYPAAVAAMPFVVALARRTEFLWPSYAAINVLTDVVGYFEPEPGYDVFVRPDGTAVRVMDAVLAPIHDAENDLRLLLASDSLSQQLCKDLGELLDVLG